MKAVLRQPHRDRARCPMIRAAPRSDAGSLLFDTLRQPFDERCRRQQDRQFIARETRGEDLRQLLGPRGALVTGHMPSSLGQREDGPPPVRGVRVTLHKAALLKGVRRCSDGLRADPFGPGKSARRSGANLLKTSQRGQLRRGKPALRWRVPHAAPERPDAYHQCSGYIDGIRILRHLINLTFTSLSCQPRLIRSGFGIT